MDEDGGRPPPSKCPSPRLAGWLCALCLRGRWVWEQVNPGPGGKQRWLWEKSWPRQPGCVLLPGAEGPASPALSPSCSQEPDHQGLRKGIEKPRVLLGGDGKGRGCLNDLLCRNPGFLDLFPLPPGGLASSLTADGGLNSFQNSRDSLVALWLIFHPFQHLWCLPGTFQLLRKFRPAHLLGA